VNRIDLNGRSAVVTGGARGIGYACGERLKASGAAVSLWDRDAAALADAAARLGAAHSIAMDVADEAGVCVYTATGEPGVVAFASQRPGGILSVDVGPQDEGYLLRRSGLMARTPGVRVRPGPAEHGLGLWRIGGSGRAWVERPLSDGRSQQAMGAAYA